MKRLVKVAIVVIVLVVCFGGMMIRGRGAEPRAEKRCTSITVQYGDTLSSIAEEYYSEEWGSTEEYVKEIMRANRLYEDKIHAGSSLIIPYYVH